MNRGPSKTVETLTAGRDTNRVDILSRTLQRIDSHAPGTFALHLLRETIRLWRDVINDGGRFEIGRDRSQVALDAAEATSFVSHMDQAEVEEAISALSTANLRDDDDVRRVVDRSLAVMEEMVRSVAFTPLSVGPPQVMDSNGVLLNTREVGTEWLSRVANLRESLRGLVRLVALENQTRESMASMGDVQQDIQAATRELDQARAALAEVRAEQGQIELSSQFRKLARWERMTSWVFRVLTFAGLGATVWIAWKAASETNEWADILGHLAVVVAVGSAAAYMARLASAHGATADWAKAVQVQLLTFKDFLGVIEAPDVKHRVYEEFGRRVLGPPPGKGDEAPPLPTTQLLELANVIAAARKSAG